jgi:deoxyribonuclease-2
MRTVRLTIAFAILLIVSHSQQLSCTDEKGSNVDWFAALRVYKEREPRVYLKHDSNTRNGKFKEVSEFDFIGGQFKQIDLDEQMVMLWNDGHPYEKGRSFLNNAHSKGILAWDDQKQEGLWIIHSIPWYPFIEGNKLNPFSDDHDNRSVYGQSMMCISIKSEQEMARIFGQITATNPNIYYDGFKSRFPLGNIKEQAPLVYQFRGFTMLTKPHSCKRHFLSDVLNGYWATQGIKDGFYVRTWGKPFCSSICGGTHKSVIVKKLKFGQWEWKGSQEHSKWAIGFNPKWNLVCIGGLNFQMSQYKRGGGYVCLQNESLYKAMKSIIVEVDCENGESDFPNALGCSDGFASVFE